MEKDAFGRPFFIVALWRGKQKKQQRILLLFRRMPCQIIELL
jgi:hypothetical protein